jgi:Zn-dependent protease
VDILLNCIFVMALGIPAMILHECGHLSVAWLCGVKVKRIGVSLTGLYTVREPGPKWANVMISFAGPVLNLLLAVMLREVLPTFALVNLVACVYNLLPIPNSDGRRIMGLFAAEA